jgi:hypothetical protein
METTSTVICISSSTLGASASARRVRGNRHTVSASVLITFFFLLAAISVACLVLDAIIGYLVFVHVNIWE